MLTLVVGCGTQPSGENATPAPAPTTGSVPNAPAYWPTDGWRPSTPEEQGMDPDRLGQVLGAIAERRLGIHGVVVVRNGYIVLEEYYFPFSEGRKHDLWSVTKSVTSALVGIAIEQGYIESVDRQVLSFFPNHIFANADARKEAMTLEHLLTMSSGLTWVDAVHIGEMLYSPDAVQYVLDKRMSALPGTVWNYNTGSSHLLSAILQEVTGTTTQAFAQAHLFDPLGISNVAWSADQGGITTGGWGLRLTPRDMAKLGYLYLNDGVWDGEQIVPAAWIQDSVERRFQVPNPLEPWDLYYGYSWWLHQIGPYAAHGRHGQFIYVLPDLDLVVVFTGGLDESEFVQPEVLIRDYVMPAVTVIDSP